MNPIEDYLVRWFLERTVLELVSYAFTLEGDVIQTTTPEIDELIERSPHETFGLDDERRDYGHFAIGPLILAKRKDGHAVMHSGLIDGDEALERELTERANLIRIAVDAGPVVIKIAMDFSEALREQIPDCMDELVLLNRGSQRCRSSDYCDANVLMSEAMAASGYDFNDEDETHVKLWNDAWAYAKRFEFGHSVSSEDADDLTSICRQACDEIDLELSWAGYIESCVDSTNGVFGSAGRFDPNVGEEYASMVANAISVRLARGESADDIRAMDFTTVCQTATDEGGE